MLNRRTFMISTILVSAAGTGIGNAWAQCAITDCETLGYTETYNSGGNCLKCPFGDKYNCEKGYICPDEYTQDCNGENMVGVGEACNGKYAECACKEGYKLVDGECQFPWGTCSGLAANCSLGDILFSDGTCSANTVSGKTPIAVVVYKSGNCGQAMALKSLGSYYKWSSEDVDISGLTNLSQSQALQDFVSCENSAKIRAQGNSITYPAVWAAYNYTTTGTKVGDWCLPAAGIFTSIYNNQSTINTGFSRANGTQFTNNSTYAWSSSEYSNYYAWSSSFYNGYGLLYYDKDNSRGVRPVLEF